ncbi:MULTISPECIES: hypothetical protein [unclassified Chelatococcus]|uniref:spermidine synthase n=1 Tax=unclassified Chelatococcus TaxID=2638111 RepID=UPI001BCDBD00|nr:MULTISPECIES: hypothetical protein [unclassified Chelatococcus]MBS7696709.1 hypothetical protein [Chelatococcus sp. YT9]MBX3555274.1 hypothetical protein [Chelatococcus sp.]
MLPWITLDTAKIPDASMAGGDGELRLKQRGQEFSIMLGTNELMNSRLSGSEEALARLGCAPIASRSKPHVLIGGLGMGFTLRAALTALGTDARITVAELVPAVVSWARGPMAGLFAGSLEDARVTIREDDVAQVMRERGAAFDAILLDVDNGPEGLTSEANDNLYSTRGLGIARAALRPGGILAVWSAAPDSAFAQRLRRVGFAVEEARVRADRGRSGARHVIWVAAKDGGGAAPRPRSR